MRTTLIHRPSARGFFEASGLIWAFLLSLGLIPNAFAADAGENAIEEVVVTGSYLKRSVEDSPSPLALVSSADIEDLGAQSLADVIQTLPWQTGSVSRTSTFGGEGGRGAITFNLRNLGQSSTLVLLNGKRNVSSFYDEQANAAVNVNALIPNIAVERIEIVKDGASALYGSDAIAGVVNFITKKDFEGFDVQYEWQTDHETKKGDTNNLQMIFGTQGDRGGVVVSAGVRNQDRITVADRYDRFGGSTASGTGQPGRFFPAPGDIVWAANGLNPGEVVPFAQDAMGDNIAGSNFPRAADGSSYGRADVNCEHAAALGEGGPLTALGAGTQASPKNTCAYDFGSFFPLQGEESFRQFHVQGHYDLSDTAELYYEFGHTGSEFARTNSLNPNALTLPIPIHHPGLIEDARRRGIEPVVLGNGTRLIGGTADASQEDRPIDTETVMDRNNQRLQLGVTWDLELAGRAWTADVSYTASEGDRALSEIQDTQSVEFELAINGFGGPNCNPFAGTRGEGNAAYAASGGDFNAGQCYYFNPFGNAAFTENGGRQDDLALRNPPELYQYLLGRVTSDSQFRQRVIDAVFAGDLFDMNSGALGLAVGFQRREDSARVVFDAATNSANLDFVYGATDWGGTLTTTAVFAEVNIPVVDSLEVNAALRWEDFDEIGESTTDPKVSVIWRPAEAFTARASWGSSFRVASLQQLFGSLTTVHNMTDAFSGTAYRAAITGGNRNLKPESTDMFNVGFSWIPQGALEGLQIDLDYYDYDYEDIIGRENYTSVLESDEEALQEAIAGGQTLLEAIGAGVGNRDQVVRNGDGVVVRVLPNFLNLSSATISGIDLKSSYRFDTGIGIFRVGLQGNFGLEYEVVTDSEVYDGLGFYNENNPIAPRRPHPKFKLNATLNWQQADHSAFLAIRHVDGYKKKALTRTDGFWRATVTEALGAGAGASFYTDNIDSWTTADIQYTYNIGDTLGNFGWTTPMSVSVGAKNVTNEEPPWVPYITAYDPVNHDPRGRVWYMRLSASF